MRRWLRVSLVLVFFLATNSAWAKWKPEEQEYLDNQFRTLQEQVAALKKQVDSLATQLAEAKQSQAALQELVTQQQAKLAEMGQAVSTFRLVNNEQFNLLKTALGQLREEQQKGFNTLSGQANAAAAAAAAAPPAKPVIRGYITAVKGDTITVDLGTVQGVQVGSQLSIYKSSDPNTPVGTAEVTEVLDTGTSNAHVVQLQPSVTLAFSDIVHHE